MRVQSDPTTNPTLQLKQRQVISEIPHEIFLEVVSYLGPASENGVSVSDIMPDIMVTAVRNRMIHNIALVCRHFYHHLFPLLFEYVYNDGSSAPSNGEEDAPSHRAAFCRSIVAGDERSRILATYTKRFAIVGLHVGKKYLIAQENLQAERDLYTASKALAYMTNLQELCLYNTSITDDFLRSTTCLPQLNVLRLAYCNIPKPLNADLLVSFSALHVARVYAEQDISSGDAVPYDQFTRHLCLSRTESFSSDICVESRTLRGLAASSAPMGYLQRLHLERIHIDRAQPDLLSRVLAVMPALKSLHITKVHYYSEDGDSDGEDFTLCMVYPKLPQLMHVYAPLFAVHALVPGSSASSVGFSREYIDSSTAEEMEYDGDAEFWQRCAIFLGQSKYHMYQLDVPVSFYSHIPFATCFPELRRLTINTRHCNWRGSSFWWPPEMMIISFLAKWQAHPRLKELHFIYESSLSSYSSARISLGQDTMNRLKEKIPTLRVLKFLYTGSHSEQYVDMSESVSN